MSNINLIISVIILSLFFSCSDDNTTNPIQDNYETVKIGTQVWMKKNLDVDHYRNGDTIPQVTDPTQWANQITGAWCYYNNDSELGVIYGKLYNWYAVNDSRGLAPTGWHITTDVEWTQLENFLGGSYSAGCKLKEAGTEHWAEPNLGATNESGFSALPGGSRHPIGAFFYLESKGNWWTSTESSAMNAWYMTLVYDWAGLGKLEYSKGSGFSVRCVKDR